MAYYPKNKAKIKPSKEGEFIYQDDNTPFQGTYIKTSKGQYFEGENINFPGRVIIPTQSRQRKNNLLSLLKNLLSTLFNSILIQQLLNELLSSLINPGDIFNINQLSELLNNAEGRELTEDEKNQAQLLLDQIDYDEVSLNNTVVSNSKYNDLKPGIFTKLNRTRSIISTKIKPTDKDYINGGYLRYFTKRNNILNDFLEINKFTYDSIISRKSIFDINLYQVFSIRWDLGENSQEVNTNILSRYERSLPGIKSLFSNPLEFSKSIKNNLVTEGNELYFENGEEYKGEYHIHPIQGPMVGPTHTIQPHSKLYYTDELGTSKNEPITQNPTLEEQQTGLFKTVGGNEYYIKENKFGIFAEVVDTITNPPSVIYTSRTYLKLEISPKDLIELTTKEIEKGVLPKKSGSPR